MNEGRSQTSEQDNSSDDETNEKWFKTEELILKIEARPILYDKRLSNHKDKLKINDIWLEIAQELYKGDWEKLSRKKIESLVEDLIRRWRSVRDNHSRCKRKKKKGRRSGSAAPKPQTEYRYTSMLHFLQPCQALRVTENSMPTECNQNSINNVPENEDLTTENTTNEEDHNSTLTSNIAGPRTTNRVQTCQRPVQGKRPLRKVAIDPEVMESMRIAVDSMKRRNEERKNELSPTYQFLVNLLPHMEKVPETKMFDAKLAIMQTIKKFIPSEESSCDSMENIRSQNYGFHPIPYPQFQYYGPQYAPDGTHTICQPIPQTFRRSTPSPSDLHHLSENSTPRKMARDEPLLAELTPAVSRASSVDTTTNSSTGSNLADFLFDDI